jgi:NAD(P)-dependent dehydrogenase (short-subunit alcohol dehydrogenase family)
VTKRSSIEAMVERVVSDAGTIDNLVNNAAVFDLAPITEVTEKSWDILYAVNAKGLFFTLQAVARQMINQGHGGRSRPGSTSSSMASM